MTEKPLSISTQIATPNNAALIPTTTISANDALTSTESGVEDYTIKCICNWDQDDGATVYCEKCDTWQHIECFYPGQLSDASKEDFDHSCADCKPRPLDRQRAVDYQRSQRQIKADTGDKKSKRGASKSHKKKPKPSEIQAVGHNGDDQRNGSPQDFHSHNKKVKGHRSRESVSSQYKRSPHLNSRLPSHVPPPSPAHTPPELPNNFRFFDYSDTFVSLYNGEQATEVNTNSMASIGITNIMSQWLTDEGQLMKDVGQSREDVFRYLTAPAGILTWPNLLVEQNDIPIDDDGTIVRLRSLKAPQRLRGGAQIGELNGIVGMQRDYIEDLDSQWMEGYVHPKPLFFFPPHLPLVIDTRKEGSKCHYARRSCNANTTLETYIDPHRPMGYHFWLISDRPIDEDEQITLPWDFHFPAQVSSRFMHLLNLTEEDGERVEPVGITDEEYEKLSGMLRTVLSDYGGCACGLGNDCSFARFHRNYHGRSQPLINGVKLKKGRKPKQNHVSPTSTGHATNSRAASESQQDQYDDDDRRSISGSSSRSKPHSRDMTPINSVTETNGIISSDREKRKIAMAEDSFRKMEQIQPPRKKKRASDGTVNSTTTLPVAPKPRQRSVASRQQQQSSSTTGNTEKRRYIDASTSRRRSGSAVSVASPNLDATSPGATNSLRESMYKSRQVSVDTKASYAEASTQTEPDENAWYNTSSQSSKKNRPIIPLQQRLLRNRHRSRLGPSAQQSALGVADLSIATSPTVSMDLDFPLQDERSHPESPTDSRGRHTSIASSSPSVDNSTAIDIAMSDAPSSIPHTSIKPPPPPWPAQPVVNGVPLPGNSHRSPDLRVQMPTAPSFSMIDMSGSPSPSLTPSSAAGSIAQSPFGTNFPSLFPVTNGVATISSAIKPTKKLSLSDYKRKKERESKHDPIKPTSGSSPVVSSAVLKPPLDTIEETKATGGFEASAIIASPVAEQKGDPMDMVNINTDSTLPSQEVNGVL